MATPAFPQSTPATSSLRGTGYKQIALPRLSPQQQQLFSDVFGPLHSGIGGAVGQISQLAGGGTPEQWAQLEAPALRQFGQLQGALGARFSGMGTGAQRSSAFQQAGNSAAQELAEQLQSQRLGLQQNAIQQLLGLYGNLMGTQTFENAILQKQIPPWKQALIGLAGGLGQLGQSGGQLGIAKYLGAF